MKSQAIVEDLLPKISGWLLPTPPSPLAGCGFILNKAQAKGASKEVVVQGLPPRGIVIASGNNFGVKLFSAKEIEAAVRHGVALETAPVHSLGRTKRRYSQLEPLYFFHIDSL